MKPYDGLTHDSLNGIKGARQEPVAKLPYFGKALAKGQLHQRQGPLRRLLTMERQL